MPSLRNFPALILLTLILTGCNSQGGQASWREPTASLAAQAQTEIATAHDILVKSPNSVLVLLDSINAGNYASQVPLVKARVVEADTHIEEADAKLKAALIQAKADAAAVTKLQTENSKLKASDPTMARFNFWGFVLTALSIAGFIATFFAGGMLAAAILSEIRTGCIFGTAVGLTFISIAWFLAPIRIAIVIILGVALVGGLIWAILYAIKNRSRLVNTIQSLEVGKAAGLSIPPAAAAAISMVQTPDVKAFVDSQQLKTKGG